MAGAENWLSLHGCPKSQLIRCGGNAEAARFHAAIGVDMPDVRDVAMIGRRLD